MKTLFLLTFSLLYGLNFAQGTWEKKADYPGCFTHSQIAFSVGGKGIVGLGADWCIEIWEYDPLEDVWTQKNDFVGDNVSDRPVSFAIGDRGFVTLGADLNQEYSTNLWEYDRENDTWIERAPFPGIGRGVAVGFVIGEKAYVGGGSGVVNDEFMVMKDFWVYTAETDTWEQIADFPIELSASAGFSAGGKGYVGSGSYKGEFVNTFYAYDPVTDTWTQIQDLPREEPTVLATAFSIHNQGFFGMGLTDAQKFYAYDPYLDQWTQKATYPDFRAYDEGIGFSIGDKGYMGLGDDITGEFIMNFSFYEYTPDTLLISSTRQAGKNRIDFSVYPNPSTTPDLELLVQTPSDASDIALRLFDVNGTLINSTRWTTPEPARLEVADLPAGVYFIQITSEKYFGLQKVVRI